jgi:carbon-monoxide dehydrogenase medium subunit
MKPPPLEYVRAESVEHVLAVLAESGDDAKLLAGGQSLVPMLNLRLARPELLVDIDHLDNGDIKLIGDTLELGFLVRHRQLDTDPTVRAAAPLLARCAREIGHAAIRARGTIGGSICHADPCAELALTSVTVDAELVLASQDGERVVRATDFFSGPFMTELRPGEMLRLVRVPANRSDDHWGFREIAERTGDFAVAAAACRLTITDGVIAAASIAVAGAGSTSRRLTDAEADLRGVNLDEADFAEVAATATAHLDAAEDIQVPADFRRDLLRQLVADVLTEAAGKAIP